METFYFRESSTIIQLGPSPLVETQNVDEIYFLRGICVAIQPLGSLEETLDVDEIIYFKGSPIVAKLGMIPLDSSSR